MSRVGYDDLLILTTPSNIIEIYTGRFAWMETSVLLYSSARLSIINALFLVVTRPNNVRISLKVLSSLGESKCEFTSWFLYDIYLTAT